MSAISKQVLEYYDINKPFCWSHPHNISNKCVLGFFYDEPLISTLEFLKAKRLDDKDYNLVLYSKLPEEKMIEMDVLSSAIEPVVNRRVIDILNKLCPNDFQVLPVYVKNDPEKENVKSFVNQDYFLLNILHYVDSMDYKQSKFSYLNDPRAPNHIVGINKLSFKTNCMKEHHLARELNYHSLIVASRELGLLFNKHKIKGVEFDPDDKAYGYYGYNW